MENVRKNKLWVPIGVKKKEEKGQEKIYLILIFFKLI